jgi:hypothetical protein
MQNAHHEADGRVRRDPGRRPVSDPSCRGAQVGRGCVRLPRKLGRCSAPRLQVQDIDRLLQHHGVMVGPAVISRCRLLLLGREGKLIPQIGVFSVRHTLRPPITFSAKAEKSSGSRSSWAL